MRSIGMLDLHAEYKLLAPAIREVVNQTLESQNFINGPAVVELERALALRIGVSHAVGMSSGTDALLCSLMAIGISRDDEVILPSFTFFATAGVVWRTGAKPVFVDIDPRTFNIDPSKIEAAITPRTKAIITVDLFGQCADYNAIQPIAKRRGLAVIEDAAQAIGAVYRDRQACTFGDLACLSFYPTKNLGGFGEGGMILTNNDELARTCRQLRSHGETERYVHGLVGGNFRLDTMKGAILNAKLPFLDQFTKARRRNAERYNELLRGSPVETPFVPPGHEPVYHQYSILCDRRDELRTYLGDRGVASGIYYPVPLHLQKCFAPLGYQRGRLPISERNCERIVSLPCHPMLSDADVEYVAAAVREFYR